MCRYDIILTKKRILLIIFFTIIQEMKEKYLLFQIKIIKITVRIKLLNNYIKNK